MLLNWVKGPNKAYVNGKEIAFNDKSDTGSIPSGVIVMWSGTSSNIPAGWLLCDGSNGTPDLRDRFIVGAGNQYSRGDIGGSNSVTLTTAQMPNHSHSANSSGSWNIQNIRLKNPNYIPQMKAYSFLNGSSLSYGTTGSKNILDFIETDSSGGAQVTGSCSVSISTTISSSGSGNSHENRPPYYALCFIMKS